MAWPTHWKSAPVCSSQSPRAREWKPDMKSQCSSPWQAVPNRPPPRGPWCQRRWLLHAAPPLMVGTGREISLPPGEVRQCFLRHAGWSRWEWLKGCRTYYTKTVKSTIRSSMDHSTPGNTTCVQEVRRATASPWGYHIKVKMWLPQYRKHHTTNLTLIGLVHEINKG